MFGAAAVLLTTAPASHGADPAPVQLPSSGTSISAAADELREVKRNDAVPGGIAESTAPRIVVPSLPAKSELPPTPTASEDPTGTPKFQSSPNWLVDAMTARPERRSSSGGRRTASATEVEDQSGSVLSRAASSSRERAMADLESSRHSSPDPSGVGAVSGLPDQNPLSPYLSSWISPRDWRQLRGTIERTSGDGTSIGAVAPVETSGSVNLSLPGVPPITNPAPSAVYKPLENPYLQAMTAPAPQVGFLAPASSVPALPRPNSTIESVPPAPTPTSPVPPFVKPLTDEKYFKPLKRF